ncbi:aromatic amino acid lyase [Legionella sp. PC997]|nr:aromatic amino acid lyase [Legionella sp. PC997]
MELSLEHLKLLDPSNISTANTSEKELSLVTIGQGCRLTIASSQAVSHYSSAVALPPQATEVIEASYQFLKIHVDSRIPIYGVNTNFGDQVRYIDAAIKDTEELDYYESINERQENIIRSLSCGLGAIVAPHIVRVTMMLRAHCLAQGYSGVHPALINSLLDFLNAGITPVVRCYGSIGASGDLIPLSMIAAALIGEPVAVIYQNKVMRAPEAIQLAGLKAYKPVMRDGLALINGTSFMTAIASLAVYDLHRLFKQMLAAIAMTLESLLVISSAYHPMVHQLKNQKGETAINQFFIDFWEGSQLLTDLDELRTTDYTYKPVQDYYSIRSVPQGFGPFQENLERAIRWIENEMNSVNDNPVIDVAANNIHHSANFMGYYITDACDILKMNIAQASTWMHALLANLVHPRKNHNLPVNLVPNPETHNGFRSMQLLSAALAVQNRKFAQSHQSFTLPTEGDNQDVNSLGTHAAFDFQESVANLERLTAILFLAATQALELRGIEKASKKAQSIYHTVRQYSPRIEHCRPMTEEIELIINLLRDSKI